ncbi:MAG: exodeoxyribonuclease III [Myxococcota bacterium]
MRIGSYNINSIRMRETQLLEWIRKADPDVICLQETKVTDDEFPTDELMRLGYAVAMAGQPTYNGVAIVARLPIKDVRVGLVGDLPNADRRAISATVGGVRVVNVYVPNGKSVTSPSFVEKLSWLERLRLTLDTLEDPKQPLALCGDFNICTDERDVYDPELYRGQLHFHPDERRQLARLLQFGLFDAFRLRHDEGGVYSFWDYRAGAFRRNEGLRIDYVFVTEPLVPRLLRADIDSEPRHAQKPSDHAPVLVDIKD